MDKQEIAYYLLKYLVGNYIDKVCQKYKLDKEEIQEMLRDNENEGQNILDIMELIGKNRGALISRAEK